MLCPNLFYALVSNYTVSRSTSVVQTTNVMQHSFSIHRLCYFTTGSTNKKADFLRELNSSYKQACLALYSLHSFSCMHHISILQLWKEARMEVLEPDLKNDFQQTVLATASALQSYDSVPTNNTSTQDSSSQNPCDKFGEVLLKSMQGLPLPQVTLLTPKCVCVHVCSRYRW